MRVILFFTCAALAFATKAAAPVSIIYPPVGQTAAPGATIILSVTADGNPSPFYQWRLNGVNIPGATLSTLTLNNSQPTNSGLYSVVVYNGESLVESAPAEIIVTAPNLPFTDNFADRTSLYNASFTGRGNNTGATREAAEPVHAGKRGGASLWLSWIAPADGIVVFTTRGSALDTLLAVYTNSVVSDTNLVAADDDRGGYLSSLVTFNAKAGQEYQIVVDGFFGRMGRIVLSWNSEATSDQLPRIVVAPQSQTVGPGSNATFTVVAISETTQRYQWLFNYQAINDATNSTLTITNVQASQVGLYSVVISNAVRSLESDYALLQINLTGTNVLNVLSRDKLGDLLPLPAGGGGTARLASTPTPVTQGTTGIQIYNTTGATRSPGEPNHCSVIGGASYWFSVRTASDGVLTVGTDGSDFDTVLAVYTLPGQDLLNLTPVGCDDNSGLDGKDSLIRVVAIADTTYYVVVDGIGGAMGTVRLTHGLDQPAMPSQPAKLANGNVLLGCEAARGRTYTVQASTDLVRWSALLVTNSADGFFFFIDNPSGLPMKFYRVVPSP